MSIKLVETNWRRKVIGERLLYSSEQIDLPRNVISTRHGNYCSLTVVSHKRLLLENSELGTRLQMNAMGKRLGMPMEIYSLPIDDTMQKELLEEEINQAKIIFPKGALGQTGIYRVIYIPTKREFNQLQ